jgi:hypothetical protein
MVLAVDEIRYPEFFTQTKRRNVENFRTRRRSRYVSTSKPENGSQEYIPERDQKIADTDVSIEIEESLIES